MDIYLIGFQPKIINIDNDNNGPSYWSERAREGGRRKSEKSAAMVAKLKFFAAPNERSLDRS